MVYEGNGDMPTYPAIGYPTGETAGSEVSSTYEGRHVKVLESTLIHPDLIADPLVDRGDPCVTSTGSLVGVSFNSAVAVTDYVELDTEGIWNLSVTGTESDGTADGANSAVVIGDPLYINQTDGTITKENDPSTHVPFGYALGAVAAGATTVIAVKVHWDPICSVNEMIHVGVFGTPKELDVSAMGDLGQNSPAWLRAFVSSSSIIEADEELQGIYVRVNNSGVTDAGAITGSQFKAVQDATNTTQLLQALGLKINCDLRGEGAAWQSGAEVLVEGACTASDSRQAIRFISRDTEGTLEALFQLEQATTFGCAMDTLTTESYAIPWNIAGVLHYMQLYSA